MEGHVPQHETARRKPPTGGGGTAPAPRPDPALDLAQRLFVAMVTTPGLAGKSVEHLASEALAKARTFFAVADEQK